MRYEFDAAVSPAALADLRCAVGWNRMERDLADPKLQNLFHLCAFRDDMLVGYVAATGNGVTDAYIQDLIVHPAWQHRGIGRKLMEMALARLKDDGVYMVSVIYGETALQKYYEHFGFTTMLCGQMELRDGRN